ncbi:hypothetical protein NP493_991g00021 [Ridgeia piscesae]|uniref:H15 domain-containing protein n=1 Tax=Ridgeia piscesae TaxID=27915 RepID=A0AAD9KI99_RIDPI|nr:hypothetical protein NP493_991g00021 [Ridgeia piscesae]
MSSSRLATAPSPTSSRISARKVSSNTSSSKSHPPVSEMVNKALLGIKARGGSSMTAIKKYITDTYRVDGDKMKPYIKRYVKGALETGKLVQTKGQGAAGSFRLGAKMLHQMTTKPSKTTKPKATKLKAKKASPKAKRSTSKTKGKPKKKLQKPMKKRASLTKAKGRSPAAKKRKPTKARRATPKKAATKKGRR